MLFNHIEFKIFVFSLMSSQTPYAVLLPSNFDFSSFRETISTALQQQTPLLTNEISTSDCAMPKSAIMVTYTSHYMRDLLILQHKAMETWGLRTCLENRYVTACLDAKCVSVCKSQKIPYCTLLKMPVLPPSDFGKNAYNYLMYLKHELIFEALKVAHEVFFFDVDTMIFRKPWVHTQFGRNEQGNQVLGSYDFMYQRERGRGPFCSGSVNGGQLYLRNTTSVHHYIAGTKSLKANIT